jgi:2-polyprenyl-6-methoxyphenol hydroxylase-like FAD-dependent oxidoreductase
MTSRASADWDVVVIGAGPAGGVAAYSLARRGRRVALVDRSCMPRAKVCGCCLSPGGVTALEKIGLAGVLRGASRFDRCLIAAGGSSVRVRVGEYRAIGRDVLDARIAEAAREAGATLLLGRSARVDHLGRVRLQAPTGEAACAPAASFTARVVVAADGLGGTALSERPEFEWRVSRRSRMGVGAVLRRSPVELTDGEMVMLCGRHGYLGLVRLPGGAINAAAALDPSAVRRCGGPGALCAGIARGCRGDAGALECADWRGAPLLTRRRSRVEAGNVYVLGDAAGYVEPFTGEGMTWAIEGAVRLEQIIAARLEGHEVEGAWETANWCGVRAEHRRCAVMASLARRERVMRAAIACTRVWPAAGRWAARVLGPARPRELGGATA